VLVTALLILLSGCAPPSCGAPRATTVAAKSPLPSPSPTPTAPLQLTAPTFHAGEVGVEYTAVELAATGGVQPYTWTVSTGALPDGLTLTAGGHVSGTPTLGGLFSFTVQVADAGGSAAALPGTIAIAAAPAASLIPACARYCSVEVGCVDVCGAFGTLSGGTAPFTYAIQPGGFVPVGTHLNALSLAGTFTQRAQFWQFTVVVTDSVGQTTSISPTFYVFPHISVGPSASCGPSRWLAGCNTTVAYAGGTPGASPTVKITGASATLCTLGVTGGLVCGPTSAPPPGFKASAGGGAVSISVPAAQTFYTYSGTVTLILVDQSLCAANTTCSSAASTITITITR